MEQLWKKYPELVRAVMEDHTTQKAEHGHSFYHALEVAQYAQRIASKLHPTRAGELAWIGGICHNTDRLFKADGETRADREATQQRLEHYLRLCTGLSDEERALVCEAVLDHSKPNDDNDSLVTVILKDADRLANLDATHLIRAGQFRPGIPVVDPRFLKERDPMSTFKNPTSQVENLYNTLEWEGWFRLPNAKRLGQMKCDFVRAYLARIEEELEDVGLWPFPSELLT